MPRLDFSPSTLVPRRAFVDGETLTRLVVLSDGEGRPLGDTSERHLAAPSGAQELAERHGMFDAAFGPDTPERIAARRALLETAKRESGSFTDPMVPTAGGGRLVPAPGIGVVAPPGVTAARLPLPLGEPLPAGQYVIHNTDAPHLPYLADPAASGAALITADDEAPVPISYGGNWPAPPPARLVLRGGRHGDPEVNVTPRTERGRGILDVKVAPGREVTMELASTITPAAAAVMDQLPGDARDNATNGKAILLSQRQPISFLHATRKPVIDPAWDVSSVEVRPPGATKVRAIGKLTLDGPSTGKVDLVATWTEGVDPGTGPLLHQRRQAVFGSFLIEPSQSKLTVQVSHEFGDTHRRDLSVHAVAATRFRDCFPRLPVGDPLTLRSGPADDLLVKNTTVPPRPRVHSVVPLFEWTRSLSGGVFKSTRAVVGVRVYLRRPWGVTGPKESLGVVVYNTGPDSGLGGEIDSPANDVVSRWGDDLVEGGSSSLVRLTKESFQLPTDDPFRPAHLIDPPELAGHVGVSGKPSLIVVENEVHFDEERDLWYADIRYRHPELNRPYFLRLGLVRCQFGSTAGRETSRIVTTDWIPVPQGQTVTVTALNDDAAHVSVPERLRRNRRFTATLEQRLFDLPEGSTLPPMDITVPGAEPVVLTVVPTPGPGEQLTSANEPASDDPPDIGPPQPLPRVGIVRIDAKTPEQKARLRKGRIVIREIQEGEDIRFPGGAERTVWVETVDWAALFPDHKG